MSAADVATTDTVVRLDVPDDPTLAPVYAIGTLVASIVYLDLARRFRGRVVRHTPTAISSGRPRAAAAEGESSTASPLRPDDTGRRRHPAGRRRPPNQAP